MVRRPQNTRSALLCLNANLLENKLQGPTQVLYNEIGVDSVTWSNPSGNEMLPPRCAPEYLKRDGTRLQHEYGNFDHRPNKFCPLLM